MARVCVGCGLTTDAEGLLIINAGSTWPYACDQEDLGGAIYCSPVDGIVRTAPADLARTVTNTGGITPGAPVTILNGADTTVDTVDITLTNPSTCYSARVLMVLEAEVDVILPIGTTVRMNMNSDQMYQFRNRGSGSLSTVSWQMARGQIQTLTPGQVLNYSIPINIAPLDGDLEYSRVQWRANALIVASQ